MEDFFQKLKERIDKFTVCASVSFLSFLMAFSVNKDGSIQRLQEVVSKNVRALEMNSEEELFRDLKMLMETHSFSPSTMDIVFGNELMDDFQTQSEAFYYYASKVLLQNSNFTKEEQEELVQLLKQHSFRFGEYYSSETIFRMLIEFKNVPLIRKEKQNAMLFSHSSLYGSITYDFTWKDSYVSLFHELIHSIWNNSYVYHFYNEVTADVLSGTDSYQNATALMMMIAKLGNEKEVLFGMMNHNPDLIWKSLKDNFQNDSRVLRLQEILEAYDSPEEVRMFDFGKTDELISIIEELYELKYQKPMSYDYRMQILKYIFSDPFYYISLENSFYFNGTILVNFHLGGFQETVLIVDDGSFTYQDVERTFLHLVQQCLNEEKINKDVPYYESVNYFMKHLFGTTVYEEIMKSKSPEVIFDEWNEERILSSKPYVTLEDLKDIVSLVRIGRGKDILFYSHLQSLFLDTFELHYRKKVK